MGDKSLIERMRTPCKFGAKHDWRLAYDYSTDDGLELRFFCANDKGPWIGPNTPACGQIEMTLQELTETLAAFEAQAAEGERIIKCTRRFVTDADTWNHIQKVDGQLAALRDAAKENYWMKRILLAISPAYWMQWVEGPYYATGDFDELAFFRKLRDEARKAAGEKP